MPRKSKKQIEEEKNNELQKERIAWVIISILSIVLIVFTVFKMGKFGTILNNILVYLIGSLYLFVLITLFAYGIYKVFLINKYTKSIKTIIGLYVLNILVILLTSFIANDIKDLLTLKDFILNNFLKIFAEDSFKFTGGILGSFIYACLNMLVERSGVLIIMIAMFIVTLILLIPINTYKEIYSDTKQRIDNAKIEKEKLKQEQLEKELIKQQERRRLNAERIAKEADELEKLENSAKQEEIEVEIPQKKIDTYSTDSPFLINLTSYELNSKAKATSKPKRIEVIDTQNTDTSEKKVFRANNNFIAYKVPKHYEQFLDKVVSNSSSINATSAKVKGNKVIEILKNFSIDASLVNTYIGPSVTKFEIKPDSSVKINKIMNISDNIKMELAAKDIRIEAPIPGRSAVGIEIPNVEPIPVRMLDLIKNIPSNKKDDTLLFCVGKDLMGKAIYCDISKMPHLLIAGATGSGKSVCMNSIIISLLLRTDPNVVKLVLVDPKKVEFTPYKDIPHLMWPIIDDAQMASNMLKRIVVLMEERFDAFSTVGVRNINSFNEYVDDYNNNLKDGETPMNRLPYICIIIDELADLMMIAGKDVEQSIQRITQLARASGIHLIVATQRPSTDVITGLIKSNIPSRISFAVASSIDSRTILDQTGAERLLGNGDMLYYPQGENAPIRLQGVLVNDKEIQRVTSYVKSLAKPVYEDSYFEFLSNMNGTTVMNASSANADSMDSLYNEVVEYVKNTQKASTSLLQRKFGIGYNRAARLIDTLEDRGIIGPSNGSKSREVYLKADDEE